MRSFLGTATLAVAIQMALVVVLAPGSSIEERYERLLNWDSVHYEQIVREGYILPDRPLDSITGGDIHGFQANVAFFPGYPIFTRIVSYTVGIAPKKALLLVSFLASIVFWVYFQLLLKRTGATRRVERFCMAFALVHPCSFFLIAGYTESFFLMMLFGFYFWADVGVPEPKRRSLKKLVLASLHGFGTTSTRIVGAGVIAAPLINRKVLQKPWYALAVALLSSLGAVSFFAYCHWRFGEWNLYMRLNEVGWGNFRDWFAILKPWNYVPRFFFEDTVISLNRASLPLSGALFAIALLRERKLGWQGFEGRAGLYFSAFLMFYIAVCGKALASFDSMIRISLPVVFTQILILAALFPNGISLRRKRAWAARAGIFFAFATQVWFIYRFTRGGWIA